MYSGMCFKEPDIQGFDLKSFKRGSWARIRVLYFSDRVAKKPIILLMIITIFIY